MTKFIVGGVAAAAVIGGIIWWGLQEESTKETFNTAVTTYFFGEECPHCRNVRKFLDENKIEEKFGFEKREVWHDRENARLMQEAAKICDPKPASMGVPFVFSDGKCYVGEPDVMKFFKQKAGLE